MFKVKAIIPDTRKMTQQMLLDIEKQVQKAFQEQANREVSKTRCPIHGQRPVVRLSPVRLSSRPRHLRYHVSGPCCQKLVEEVEGVLGSTIPLAFE